ncbi:hypothetical protein [Sphingomonas sp.]|jgi:hypothetical protein|uniref:hypothetical protein n=1 Tax=Sphingomonas sp. TaxID=28214 RepID=UPI00356AD5AD
MNIVKSAAAGLWRLVAPNTEWLVLLAVASLGAWLYAQLGQIHADRDRLAHFAEVTCAASGTPFPASTVEAKDKKGKLVAIAYPAGKLCGERVLNLAKFERETDAATAQTLADAMSQHDEKSADDAARAARDAKAARDSTERLEKADAEIDDSNRVGGSWFDAVNDVGGLRPARR